MHRKTLWYATTLLVLLAGPVVAQPRSEGRAAPPAKSRPADGWPSTRAGVLARGWVTAFCAGEADMKAFLAKELAPKSLESKSLNQRVARYRGLREQYGRLELASVVKSTPGELAVKLMDAEAKLHEFVFTVQTQAPFKLVSVGIRQAGHFGLGGHGGFGH